MKSDCRRQILQLVVIENDRYALTGKDVLIGKSALGTPHFMGFSGPWKNGGRVTFSGQFEIFAPNRGTVAGVVMVASPAGVSVSTKSLAVLVLVGFAASDTLAEIQPSATSSTR